MKTKEFENIINNSYTKERQAIYDNLKKMLDIPDDAVTATVESRSDVSVVTKPTVQKPASKWRNFFKRPVRLATCISVAVAVACLAIILPFTLNRYSGFQATTPPSTSDNPTTSGDRFCRATACKQIELKYTFKEYSERNNLSLLYVDWYDVADIKTSMYVNKENSFDIVYYEEILKHKGTGSIVELYITDAVTKVDKIEKYKKFCKKVDKTSFNDIKALWGFDTDENGEPYMYTAWIPYDAYRYTVVLRYAMNENDIFDLIDTILRTIKKF